MVSRIAICSSRLRTKSSANPSTSPGWICERIRYLHRRSLNFYRERGLFSFFFPSAWWSLSFLAMHRDETGWILFNIKFGNVVLGDGNPSNQMSSVDEQFFHHRNARFKDETIRFAREREREFDSFSHGKKENTWKSRRKHGGKK